jgi:sugar/nucleoside kinase (ribokinase family)
MSKMICIGSSSKDVFFPNSGGIVMDTPEDLTSKQKLAFELGAKFQVDKIYEAPGGCAANVSQGVARLGVDVGCFTKVGGDALGRWIISELESEGVDSNYVQVDEDCVSDLSAIIVDEESKKHLIFFNRDANTKLEIIPEKIRDTEWIFVSALNGDWSAHLDKISEIASENDIKIAFTPGQRNIRDDKERIIEFARECDVLIMNKDESIELVSHVVGIEEERLDDEEFLIKELLKFGAKVVVITDGERGAWGNDGSKTLHAGAVKKDVVDTLGAGDAFTSGFLSCLIKGKDLGQCLGWGIVNGGNVVRFYGAKEGLLNEGEIVERVKEVEIREM